MRHPSEKRDGGDRSKRSDESLKRRWKPGASVARVARRHAVNANQVFYWRKKYREGGLGKVSSSNLLPVTISEIPTNKSGQDRGVAPRCTSGTMEIQVAKGQLRVMGNVEAEALRTVL